ncbi:MAG: HAD-IA family hydrolase [Cyanobacteriota bacterium]|nr:HAD-IA family hydrolase [Cyanobacteriota bacterium]
MAQLLLRGEPLFFAGQPADIRAVLFDKDGTMSRSEPKLLALATSRLRHCLSLVGQSAQTPLADLLMKAYGLHGEGTILDPAGITAVAARDHNLIGTAVALTLVGHGWPESLALAQETFRLADHDHPPALQAEETTEGFLDFLHTLHRSDVQCAVISNDDCPGIQRFLDRHGLSPQISAIWSADHHPRKPDPLAIHHLCSTLGIPPAHCALIGDANSDLGMARKAGVAVMLGYRGGWQQPVQLEAGYVLLDHWQDLAVVPDQGVSTATCSEGAKT